MCKYTALLVVEPEILPGQADSSPHSCSLHCAGVTYQMSAVMCARACRKDQKSGL